MSGMNKVFLFKGKIVIYFCEYFGFFSESIFIDAMLMIDSGIFGDTSQNWLWLVSHIIEEKRGNVFSLPKDSTENQDFVFIPV